VGKKGKIRAVDKAIRIDKVKRGFLLVHGISITEQQGFLKDTGHPCVAKQAVFAKKAKTACFF
jgi:hypothetical protein